MGEAARRAASESGVPAPQPPRRRSLWKRLAVSCAIGLVTLAILELGLSILAAIFYPRLTRTDERLGWIYNETSHPVSRRFVVLGGQDIVYNISINSDGFRDEPFARRPDWLQIMVLGDSLTFGLEADQSELFCHLLEMRLREHLGTPNVDVMNFGLTGFAPCQETLVLEHYVDKVSPNAVVLMLNAENDFRDNANYATSSRVRPIFLLDGDGIALRTGQSPGQRLRSWLRDNSTLFFLLSNVPLFRGAVEASIPYTDEQKVELMCRILKRMQADCASREIPLFVFYIRHEADPDAHRDAIAELCDADDIPFKEFPLWKRPGFAMTTHWGPEGHQKTAEVLFDTLAAHPLIAARLEGVPESAGIRAH